MFKNTTRRGLAIASALSLAFAGLVSAPAQANTVPFELKASAGTGYNTFVTETFTLEAVLGSANPSGGAQLKYAVSKATGFVVKYGASTNSAVATSSSIATGSTSAVIPAVDAGQTTRNYLRLAIDSATSVSATANVTVTAFIDVNNNGVVDANEPQSAQTVSFKKYSDVASVVTVTTPLNGDTVVAGTATITDINLSQVQKSLTAVVTLAGSSTFSSSVLANGSFSVSQSITAGQTASAVVLFDGSQIGAASATVTAGAASVKAVTVSAVTGDNAKGLDVRRNSAFAVTAKVLNGTTDTASGVAAVAVTAKVTISGGVQLNSSVTITVNGTTYTDSAKLPTALALTSDANGNVTLNVSSANLSASNEISFAFTSQNVTSATLITLQKDAEYTVKPGGTGFLTVAPGGAVAAAFTVADQWGVAAPAGHRLEVTYGGTTKYSNLTNGATSVDYTATTSTTTTTADVQVTQLQKQDTLTLNWSNVSAVAATASSKVVVKVTTVAGSFTTAPTHSAKASISRVVTTSPGLNNGTQITGVVNHAGASVTVTGTGVKFSTDGKTVVTGTVTVVANGSGQFTVSAYIHKAGAATLNYTVGTATASTTVTVDAAAADAGKKITFDKTAIPSGETSVITGTLVDEYDNPVAVTTTGTPVLNVLWAGKGLPFSGIGRVATDSTGKFSVTVLALASEVGTATLTANYQPTGSSTGTSNVTVASTITIGTAAPEINAVIGTYQSRWAVRVENARGAVVSVKVGGNWFKFNSLNDNYLFSRKSVAGRTLAVTVWVNGELQNSQTITIRK